MPEVTDADREKALLILPLSESKRDRLYISWAQLRETIAHALAEAREDGAMKAREEVAALAEECCQETSYPGAETCVHRICEDCLECFALAVRALPLIPPAAKEKP